MKLILAGHVGRSKRYAGHSSYLVVESEDIVVDPDGVELEEALDLLEKTQHLGGGVKRVRGLSD